MWTDVYMRVQIDGDVNNCSDYKDQQCFEMYLHNYVTLTDIFGSLLNSNTT